MLSEIVRGVFAIALVFHNVVHCEQNLDMSYHSLMEKLSVLPQHAENIMNSRHQLQIEPFKASAMTLMSAMLSNFKHGNGENIFQNMRVNYRTQLMEIANSKNISYMCVNNSIAVVDGLWNRQMWAFRMIDATGKPPNEILDLNLDWWGSYDECVGVVANATLIGRSFKGRYCTIAFPFNVTTPGVPAAEQAIVPDIGLNLGTCVPDSCSNEDVLAFVSAVISLIPNKSISALMTPSKVVCQVDVEYDSKAVAVLVVISLFCVVMAIATGYDVMYVQRPQQKTQEICEVNGTNPVYKVADKDPLIVNGSGEAKRSSGLLRNILLSFSVYNNATRLLSTHQSEGTLTAVHGIRFLSITWVMLGHTSAFGLIVSENFIGLMPKLIKKWSNLTIFNGIVCVDSFFTLSGLLVSYLTLMELKKKSGKLNWGMFYLHRYWRLTPPYALVMMLYIPLSPYFSDGPRYPIHGFERDFCQDTWWTNLLYVNNVVKVDKMCMGWSWYLSNDMQFFILSPLMLIPLYFIPKLGMVICGLFVLGTSVASGLISVSLNLPPTLFGGVEEPIPSNPNDRIVKILSSGVLDYFQDYYIRPYCRIGPYIIGIITGYILFKTECKCTINKFVNLTIWLVMAVVGCIIVYGVHDTLNGHPMTAPVSAFYNATTRSLWGVCLSWVIFACATGNGGIVNTLLSWRPLIPLSRLTYCTYLIHPIVMFTYYLSLRRPVYFTNFTMALFYMGFVMISFICAFVVSLAFESPMMALEKALFRKSKPKIVSEST